MKNICKKLLLLATFACVSNIVTAVQSPLHIAAWDGDLARIQALLADGAEVNAQDGKVIPHYMLLL